MKVLVVGAGPSGLHCAQSLLDLGHQVTMLDVGHRRTDPVKPNADFATLKDTLSDPVEYFLGDDARGVVMPSSRAKFYAFPPTKDYVFRGHQAFRASGDGFDPLFSFAAGGLAEAWTAGCYPLNDHELADFPISYAELREHYATVIERIGVTASRDDLSRFTPWFDSYDDPIDLDPHSSLLMRAYVRNRQRLNGELGFHLGRSRVALLVRDRDSRKACAKLGRCLWGCPTGSLYAPSATLRELLLRDAFSYVDDRYVTHFQFDGEQVTTVIAKDSGGRQHEYDSNVCVLAAGALNTSRIFLDSLFRKSGQIHRLHGLMDNRQIMVPFVNLRMLGKPVDTHAYQFHQLALGLERSCPAEYVHGQITALKSCAVHPIVHSMPFNMRAALNVFRATHASLGVANIWLHDRRRSDNFVTIRPRHNEPSELVMRYRADDSSEVTAVSRAVKRALRKLGCIAPPGMTKSLDMGSSVHYAGTIPMRSTAAEQTCDKYCRSADFRNLYFADGVSFPFLPAKNLTFTLMANAIRVAHAIDRAETHAEVA